MPPIGCVFPLIVHRSFGAMRVFAPLLRLRSTRIQISVLLIVKSVQTNDNFAKFEQTAKVTIVPCPSEAVSSPVIIVSNFVHCDGITLIILINSMVYKLISPFTRTRQSPSNKNHCSSFIALLWLGLLPKPQH